MTQCWRHNPKTRPTFLDILRYLAPDMSAAFNARAYYLNPTDENAQLASYEDVEDSDLIHSKTPLHPRHPSSSSSRHDSEKQKSVGNCNTPSSTSPPVEPGNDGNEKEMVMAPTGYLRPSMQRSTPPSLGEDSIRNMSSSLIGGEPADKLPRQLDNKAEYFSSKPGVIAKDRVANKNLYSSSIPLLAVGKDASDSCVPNGGHASDDKGPLLSSKIANGSVVVAPKKNGLINGCPANLSQPNVCQT